MCLTRSARPAVTLPRSGASARCSMSDLNTAFTVKPAPTHPWMGVSNWKKQEPAGTFPTEAWFASVETGKVA